MRAVEDTARRYFELVSGTWSEGMTANKERWFLTLGQIAFKLNERLTKLRSAKDSTGKLGMIVPTLTALCEIYRNPLSHPEIVKLDEDGALEVFGKGIDVISTMIQDVLAGGGHFSNLRASLNDFSWCR